MNLRVSILCSVALAAACTPPATSSPPVVAAPPTASPSPPAVVGASPAVAEGDFKKEILDFVNKLPEVGRVLGGADGKEDGR